MLEKRWVLTLTFRSLSDVNCYSLFSIQLYSWRLASCTTLIVREGIESKHEERLKTPPLIPVSAARSAPIGSARLEAQFTAVSRARRSCRVVSCHVVLHRVASTPIFLSTTRGRTSCADRSKYDAVRRVRKDCSQRIVILAILAFARLSRDQYIRVHVICAIVSALRIVSRHRRAIGVRCFFGDPCRARAYVCVYKYVYMCRLRGMAWRRAPRLNDRYAFGFGSAGLEAKFMVSRCVSACACDVLGAEIRATRKPWSEKERQESKGVPRRAERRTRRTLSLLIDGYEPDADVRK